MADAELAAVARQREVEFAGKTVAVREMSTRNVLAALQIIDALADRALLQQLTSGDSLKAVEGLFTLIKTVPARVVELAKLGSTASEDDILDATPRQVLGLVTDIWEVNEFTGLLKKKAGLLLVPILAKVSASGPPNSTG